MFRQKETWAALFTLLAGLGIWGMGEAEIDQFSGTITQWLEGGAMIIAAILVALGINKESSEGDES